MKKYIVTGKKYLSKQEYYALLEKGNYTHVKKAGEQKYTPIASENLEYNSPWIDISAVLRKKRDAIKYAGEIVNNGINGSYAIVEKVTDFLWIHTRVPIHGTSKGISNNLHVLSVGSTGSGKTAERLENGNNARCDAVLKCNPFRAEEMMGVMRGKGRSRSQILHDAVSGMVRDGVSCEKIVSRLNGVADKEEIEKVYEIVKPEMNGE